MALSLYRKYRPQTFKDVVGQEHIEQTLKNAVLTGNVSHAYLFCGPRGTGKTTTARILAKALLCENSPTEEPDGTCSQCLQIADGVHPDVYELDAASRTGVENVREEIIGRVQFAPTQGTHKIYIIDEVHMLSTAAFNALLKTLEEPPSHVVFVLCTTDPHKVPPTILSRCQRFDFHRLSEQQISQRLQDISDTEGFTVEPAALNLIALRSQGGMRDAINALEQVAVFGGGKVSYSAAEDMLGEVSDSQLFGISELMAKRDIAGCFEWVAAFSQTGTDIAQFVRDLTAHIRNLYVAGIVGNNPGITEILDADVEKGELYRQQALAFGSSDRLAHIMLVLGDLTTELRSAANARLSLEIALTRIVRPESDLSLEALAARLDTIEQGSVITRAPQTQIVNPSSQAEKPAARTETVTTNTAESESDSLPMAAAPLEPQSQREQQPSQLEPQQPSPQPMPQTLDLSDLANARHLWAQVEREIKSKRRAIATMFGGSRAHLDKVSGGLLIELPTTANFAKTTLERPENLEFVRTMVKQVFGQQLKVSYSLGAPSNASGGALEMPQDAAKELVPEKSIQAELKEDASDANVATTQALTETDGGELSFEAILANSFGTNVIIEEIPSSKGDM